MEERYNKFLQDMHGKIQRTSKAKDTPKSKRKPRSDLGTPSKKAKKDTSTPPMKATKSPLGTNKPEVTTDKREVICIHQPLSPIPPSPVKRPEPLPSSSSPKPPSQLENSVTPKSTQEPEGDLIGSVEQIVQQMGEEQLSLFANGSFSSHSPSGDSSEMEKNNHQKSIDKILTCTTTKPGSTITSGGDAANVTEDVVAVSAGFGSSGKDGIEYVPTPISSLHSRPQQSLPAFQHQRLLEMKACQEQRLVLNVGGVKIQTSAPILMRDPCSILAALVSPLSPLKPYVVHGTYHYYIERDGRLFNHILNYLRNGCPQILHSLPDGISDLRQLQEEANFYVLRHLELLVQQKLLQLQNQLLINSRKS